jgi:putative nucleotidyltransferase with HDIG domain
LIGIVIEQRPFKVRLREGDVALKAVYAPYDFVYSGVLDKQKTQQERQKAINAVKEIYSLNRQALDDELAKLDSFFEHTAALKAQTAKALEEGGQAPPAKLPSGLDIALSENSTKTFLKAEDIGRLTKEIKDVLSSFYSQGILSKADKSRLMDAAQSGIVILDAANQIELVTEIEKVASHDEVIRDIPAEIKRSLSEKRITSAASELLQGLIAPNLAFESNLTESRRQAAADAVSPQYQQVEMKKGQLILAKGQRVTKEHIAQLLKIEESESRIGRVRFLTGTILLVVLLLFVVTVYLALYEPRIFHNTSYLALIGVLSSAIIFIARAIIISPLPSYIIPLAGASMLMAVLLNQRLAIFITVLLSIAIGINVENSLNLVITFLFGSLVGIFSIRNITKRWHIIRAGILVGLTNFVCIIAIGLLNNLNPDIFVTDSAWGFINGIICAFIVMGIMPLLEDLFKITTNITLLELSDMNHPLLKQMVLKAPGTYHHSLMVGNLAEAAAETIGANPLLARVGAYYHDVGKIQMAEYFTENQTNAESLHDKLTPSMSRLIITNHVKDGIELGRKYNLKNDILDFIGQHHGTGLVYYFFQKALERVEDDTILSQEGFRYEGPKPQTKETAIVLLADSVEAASRTLANPTPSRVEELTHRIINNKFIDGQLDECDLTLKDLNKIAAAFARILMGVLHSRVEYPNNDEDKRS